MVPPAKTSEKAMVCVKIYRLFEKDFNTRRNGPPPMTQSQTAFKKMKNGNEILVELFKMAGESYVLWMTNLFNLILTEGKVLDDWRQNERIPFYKNVWQIVKVTVRLN